MNSIKHLELQQCRTCYNSKNNLQLLTSFVENSGDQAEAKTYVQLLLEICNINVKDDSSLGEFPQFICLNCSNKLKLAHDFIEHTCKINKFLKSLADVLNTKSRVDFIEKPPLDIPSEIKIEKDDDIEFISNDREFLYSPVDTETNKLLSTILPIGYIDKLDTTPCNYFTSVEKYPNNRTIENDNEQIKEESTVEFTNNDIIVREDLNNFSSGNINNTDDTKWHTNAVAAQCNKSFQSCLPVERLTRNVYNSKEIRSSRSRSTKKFIDQFNSHVERAHKVKSLEATNVNTKSGSKNQSKTKKGGKRVSCNECQKVFTSLIVMERHKRSVHITEEEKITCVYCGHKFSRADNYKRHMKVVHGKTVVSPPQLLMKNKRSRLSCKEM